MAEEAPSDKWNTSSAVNFASSTLGSNQAGGVLMEALLIAISVVQAYVSIVLICIGFAGNLMSILIFTVNRERDVVSAQYLRVLAVTDTGVIILAT